MRWGKSKNVLSFLRKIYMQSSNLQNKNIKPITALDAKKLAQVSSTLGNSLLLNSHLGF
jgi:hypothetical protein